MQRLRREINKEEANTLNVAVGFQDTNSATINGSITR
jgi:hypothetical protein